MTKPPYRPLEVKKIDRHDATRSMYDAKHSVRRTIDRVAGSQGWDAEGIVPFPLDLLPELHEIQKRLDRLYARVRRHADEHVYPVRQRLVAESREPAQGAS